jgi:hypothetical protein
MARPLRLEFFGAVYHITAHGDRREPIFLDDAERLHSIDLLSKEVKQRGLAALRLQLTTTTCCWKRLSRN